MTNKFTAAVAGKLKNIDVSIYYTYILMMFLTVCRREVARMSVTVFIPHFNMARENSKENLPLFS